MNIEWCLLFRFNGKCTFGTNSRPDILNELNSNMTYRNNNYCRRIICCQNDESETNAKNVNSAVYTCDNNTLNR